MSDPAHPRYGNHLSAADVEELIKPSDEALNAVHNWLADNAIDPGQLDYTPAKDWINIRLPVSTIERLLDTEYHSYEHDDGDVLVRAPEWSLPSHLHKHIATIQPTSSFFRTSRHGKSTRVKGWEDTIQLEHIKAPPSSGSVAEVCNATLVTPLCLRTLYGTVNYKVQAAGKNFMAINDFLGEINNRSDVEIYLEMFRPEAVSGAFEFSQISVAGGTLQQTPENATQLNDGTGVEGDLDAETMIGIGWPTPLVAYSTGGLDPTFKADAFTTYNSDEPYLTWLQYITSLPDAALPSVISTSYGDDEQTIGESYAKQSCNMFAQLGARGVTVLFSSGDEGVGADGYCYSNDGKNTSTFLPAFPATCPYVTAVGATTNFTPEGMLAPFLPMSLILTVRPVAAYDPRFSTPFTSGGGFSNYFGRPAYQASAVDAYLAKYVKNEYKGLYNPAGRGYPDVAAQSQNFSTVWNGSVVPVDGTSAASPTMGGVLALVNDALIAAGKSPLGFLNVSLTYCWTAMKMLNCYCSLGCTVVDTRPSMTLLRGILLVATLKDFLQR